jgi:mannose-6-phosphate isomerase
MSILTFEEHYVPRLWGGNALETVYNKPLPNEPIGEAWLISDHPQHTSIVKRGQYEGQTLHDLLEHDAAALLGARAALTVHGRFPLLLKLLDAQDKLSIQVHPDDDIAASLGENDGGKTEMWHVLHTDPGSILYCGLPKTLTKEDVDSLLDSGELADNLCKINAAPDMSVFVPAGTIHAIGEGSLLAEIQQNSDLTYRMDDWGRVDNDGNPRELHLEKSRACVRYPNSHPGPTPSFSYQDGVTTVRILAACPFFAAEEIVLNGPYNNPSRGDTFQIILSKSGDVTAETDTDSVTLEPGEAALISGSEKSRSLVGEGTALVYYVPDLQSNVMEPLTAAGYDEQELVPLLGDIVS